MGDDTRKCRFQVEWTGFRIPYCRGTLSSGFLQIIINLLNLPFLSRFHLVYLCNSIFVSCSTLIGTLFLESIECYCNSFTVKILHCILSYLYYSAEVGAGVRTGAQKHYPLCHHELPTLHFSPGNLITWNIIRNICEVYASDFRCRSERVLRLLSGYNNNWYLKLTDLLIHQFVQVGLLLRTPCFHI